MVVRVRLTRGSILDHKRNLDRRAALALSALLTPAALVAFGLAFWRFGADMNWTGQFAITEGLFSHWQVWGAMGLAIEACAVALNRYGHRKGVSAP